MGICFIVFGICGAYLENPDELASCDRRAYIEYIRNNLIKEKITVFDNNGNAETVEFAGEKERVQKDGAKNSHPVIGEITRAKNEIKKLVILNSIETAEILEFAHHIDENSHEWHDKNGWDERTSYVMTSDDMIYPVTLYIAKARDGRNILYDVNVKIKEGVATDKIATSQLAKKQAKQAVRVTTPSDGGIITQPDPSVKGYFLSPEQESYFKDSVVRDEIRKLQEEKMNITKKKRVGNYPYILSSKWIKVNANTIIRAI